MTDTRTLKHAFDQVAEWYPENDAFVQASEGSRVTYAAANERARRIANGLADRGVGEGDRVAILADPTVEHALAFVAVQKLGAISSTLHVSESTATIREMVEDLVASAVVYDAAYVDAAEAIHGGEDDDRTFVEFGRGKVPVDASPGEGDPAPFATPLADLEGDASAAEPDADQGHR